MLLQKINLHYILFLVAIIISCNSTAKQSTKAKAIEVVNQQKPTNQFPQNNNKEIKKDTTFYHNLRPEQPLYLDEFYTDTFEVVGKYEYADYFTFLLSHKDSTFNFVYYDPDDDPQYDLARGDVVEIIWKIDTIFIAAEDEAVDYHIWIAQTKKLSSIPFIVSDTLSVLKNVLKKEFISYDIRDWAAGDINNDKIEDFVVVLEIDYSISKMRGDEYNRTRKTVLLEGIDFPKMSIKTYNNAIVDCSMCSGAGNRDPHRSVLIKDNQIIFDSNYGGSISDNFTITFQYFEENENWFLHEIKTWSYDHREEKYSSRSRTQKDFGQVSFEDYEDIKDKQY